MKTNAGAAALPRPADFHFRDAPEPHAVRKVCAFTGSFCYC
jgi:hypothetical protein